MKKYKKRIITILLAIVIVFLGRGLVLFASSEDGDINTALLGDSDEATVGLNMESLDEESSDEAVSLGASDGIVPLGFSARGLRSVNDSIGGIIQPADAAKVAIVPGTDGSAYQAYPGTYNGLLSAVYNLYANGGGQDYVIYMGSDIGVPANGVLVAETVTGTISATNVSFGSLKSKVGTLAITTSISDPSAHSLVVPADAKTFTIVSDLYFGTNIILRNLRYNPTSIFMMGNSLTLDRGSIYTAGIRIYGGSNTSNVTGNPTINITSVGFGATYIYGGNRQSGTLNGNTSVTISGLGTGTIDTVSGGSQGGTVNGNTSLTINNLAGIINNIYGGGVGTTLSPANVTGNVTTSVTNLESGFAYYYGGTYVGNIDGKITNTFGGSGKTGVVSSYYGGSFNGNIGSGLSGGSDAIVTDFNSRGYSSGTLVFYGGNSDRGIVNGNIKNKVTAGEKNKGSLNAVSGGGGIGTSTGVDFGRLYFKGKTPAEIVPAFMGKVKFQVKGNITTEITQGIVSNGTDLGFTRAAGHAGYITGNTTIEVGTEGLVTSTIPANYNTAPSTTIKNRGEATAYDIVGGGGSPGRFNTIYIKGDTKAILHNVLARWTYGGNFSGMIEGNSSIEYYAGVVDTLEGGGYNGQHYFGNTSALVHGGQVDWFLTGGGWNDDEIFGDASVIVEGGTINASMGGTYGLEATHTVYGNSTILVKGGNFSGTARTGPNGFSGGATYSGKLLGNTSVTIDLRDASEDFILPAGTFISGGRRYGATSILGTDSNNTIELNIFTDSGNDVLNGASIYGDGGATAANTKSGSISININAPDSKVGKFYATEYSNLSGGAQSAVLRKVTVNIDDLLSIDGISGGNDGDNFTNAELGRSTNTVSMNFNTDSLKGQVAKTFSIGDAGVYNFTDLRVNNATLNITTGGVKNGRLATSTNHGTYHSFGDITLQNDAGLHIGNTTSAIISARRLNVSGKATLKSPSGTGRVIITDISITGSDSLYWIRNGGVSESVEKGTWFGTNSAYKVITFNPYPDNAKMISPKKFSGTDGTKFYLGDNETTSVASTGHGIVIAGTSVNFKVVSGLGTVKHNVDKVLDTDPPPRNGASSVNKDVPVSDQGWLTIADSVTDAKLTFTPDSGSGSWIKRIKITRSDGQERLIEESTNSDPFVWEVSPKGYSYDIEVTYTDNSELTGKSVVVKESEAALIATAQDIMNYQKISGRPYLTNDINASMITEIKKPLAENEEMRSHKITYKVGVGANEITREYWIGVVPDNAVLNPADRRAAIGAKSTAIMLTVAQNITAAELNDNHTNPIVYLPDGTMLTPDFEDANIVTTINGFTAPGSVNVVYEHKLTNPAEALKISVTVTILPDGVLQLESVPDLDFGQVAIPSSKDDFWVPTQTTLSVEDSRVNPYGSNWSVNLRISDITATGGKTISAQNIFYTNTNAAVGPVGKFPTNNAITIWNSATNANNTQQLTWTAGSNQGFSVEIDPAVVQAGDYTGVATWSLIQAP